jgi:hypothetical protein
VDLAAVARWMGGCYEWNQQLVELSCMLPAQQLAPCAAYQGMNTCHNALPHATPDTRHPHTPLRSPCRAAILRVLLRAEELEAGFSFDELASLTEGYSGSDLKALCVAAAYQPIRELLAQEKKKKGQQEEQQGAGDKEPAAAGDAAGAAEDAATEKGAAEVEAAGASSREASKEGAGGEEAMDAGPGAAGAGGDDAPKLRPLGMSDMRAAMKQVGPSVSHDTRGMDEMRRWNEMFGEGGSRKDSTLTYFM